MSHHKKANGFYAEQLLKLKRLAKEGKETSPKVVEKYYSDINYTEDPEPKPVVRKSKECKHCGVTFFKPSFMTSSQWNSRRYCITFPPCRETMPDLSDTPKEQS